MTGTIHYKLYGYTYIPISDGINIEYMNTMLIEGGGLIFYLVSLYVNINVNHALTFSCGRGGPSYHCRI